MKLRKVSLVAAALTGLFAATIAVAPAALAATPAWEPDANGNGGTLSFYDASGHLITGGSDLSHLFDYAAGSTAEDSSGFHKASLAFAYPNHSLPTSSWFVNGLTAATTYPPAGAQNDLAAVPADHPISHPGATEMNLTASLGGATLDSTAGYANIVQIRMQQTGTPNSYYTADIQYDTIAGTWTETYPAASSAVSTSTALGVSPAGTQTGGSPVTLTATVTPADAVGSVQFKDGAATLGSPVAVSAGSAQLVTSSLTGGTHSLSAAFSPTDSSAFASSSSATVGYSVLDASSLSISRSTTVRYGSATTSTATLKDTRTGHGVSAVSARLYARTSTSAAWALAGSATTSSTGVATKAVRPTRRTYYQWRFAGSSSVKQATSATQTVSVSQVVVAHLTPAKIRHGKSIKVYGTVSPTSSGQKVTLQRLVGRVWKTVSTVTIKRQKLPTGKTATGFVFTVRLAKKGTYSYRVYKPATSTLLAGYSGTVHARAT